MMIRGGLGEYVLKKKKNHQAGHIYSTYGGSERRKAADELDMN